VTPMDPPQEAPSPSGWLYRPQSCPRSGRSGRVSECRSAITSAAEREFHGRAPQEGGLSGCPRRRRWGQRRRGPGSLADRSGSSPRRARCRMPSPRGPAAILAAVEMKPSRGSAERRANSVRMRPRRGLDVRHAGHRGREKLLSPTPSTAKRRSGRTPKTSRMRRVRPGPEEEAES